MKIFDHQDYRDFMSFYLRQRPKNGFGELARMAKATHINPAIITLVLKKSKDFTFEQADDVCVYLGLTDLESEYFLASVAWCRAGHRHLKDRWQKKLEDLKNKSENLKERMPAQKELSPEARAVFYSQWYYTGIRNLSALPNYNSADQISKRLNLSRAKVQTALDFLIEHGLCIENESGNIRVGPQSTHLSATDPLITRHHTNWRLKGMERMEDIKADEFFFTSPVSIAVHDISRVRSLLLDVLENIFKIIDPSPEEEVACLNIDWFRYR